MTEEGIMNDKSYADKVLSLKPLGYWPLWWDTGSPAVVFRDGKMEDGEKRFGPEKSQETNAV